MSDLKCLDGFDVASPDFEGEEDSCSHCIFSIDEENAFGGSDYFCSATWEDVTFASGRPCFTGEDG